MRISAREALEKANVTLGSEKIADTIFSKISNVSELGLKKVSIYKDMPNGFITAPMSDKLFVFEETYKYIENLLKNLGYKIEHTDSVIIISWNEIN